ncbi:MAG: superoxide dismutase [Flavobacterium sp. BFFFF1]|uniref:superoxide dismutase n=1 Tax=Flavobacterium sp. BFFFF1 TaxID=2015557 RepID=UPI000BD8A38D|nr:superoxide dismutase [Flavobacterium sp. BFFFF1]OYU79095.1 MAG: superoxide dismutase [Flavobacterium sp. BFFFF1]
MKLRYWVPTFIFTLFLFSCNEKKLHEVQVPLPENEVKAAMGDPSDVKAEEGAFEMAKLPYAYNALSPSIDARTMELHYSKHYLTYTNNLNKAVANTEFEKLPIEDILKKATTDNMPLRNNAGGYYNHTLFWESMSAKGGGQPKDTLALAIAADFGSFENFRSQFEQAASEQFGSGWAWLLVDQTGKLQVNSTPNQDNPLMPGVLLSGTPILGLDVWEHAYYIQYQYKRKNYINAFFNVINWQKISDRYEEALAKK